MTAEILALGGLGIPYYNAAGGSLTQRDPVYEIGR